MSTQTYFHTLIKTSMLKPKPSVSIVDVLDLTYIKNAVNSNALYELHNLVNHQSFECTLYLKEIP